MEKEKKSKIQKLKWKELPDEIIQYFILRFFLIGICCVGAIVITVLIKLWFVILVFLLLIGMYTWQVLSRYNDVVHKKIKYFELLCNEVVVKYISSPSVTKKDSENNILIHGRDRIICSSIPSFEDEEVFRFEINVNYRTASGLKEGDTVIVYANPDYIRLKSNGIYTFDETLIVRAKNK